MRRRVYRLVSLIQFNKYLPFVSFASIALYGIEFDRCSSF